MKKKTCLLALAAALALTFLTACGPGEPSDTAAPGGATQPPVQTEPVTPAETLPVETQAPVNEAYAREEALKTYWSEDQLTQAWGPEQVVEHMFFHPVVAYPEMAFDGDGMEKGIDDWMVTADEYWKILQSLYDNGYILVDTRDVWGESAEGMVRNTLMLPEGKKPLILDFDDVNYYEYMLENGFTYKLILGEDGNVWSYGKDPQGNDVISQDLDAITILDKFVREHPDFSLNGVKAGINLTGYQGILGYRTQTDRDITDPAQLEVFEANRQKEIEAVRPIIERLKETGWYFTCHTWGHINLANKSLGVVQNDIQRWKAEVGSLIGETPVLVYPHGARPDGDDVRQTGPIFQYLYDEGFRYFFSVGINSFSKLKTDLPVVIGDRLHPDGTTLWSERCREWYKQFYDTREIIDLSVRPDLGWYK